MNERNQAPAAEDRPASAPAADDQSIGAVLRRRREEKGITRRRAADELHMTIHQVEALEANDFDRFPAPTYARAFIKLYARYLGMDYRELTARFEAEYMQRETPAILPASPEHRDLAQKTLENLRKWFSAFPEARHRRGPLVALVVLASLALLLGLHLASRKGAARPSPAAGIPRFIEEPPAPYLDALP